MYLANYGSVYMQSSDALCHPIAIDLIRDSPGSSAATWRAMDSEANIGHCGNLRSDSSGRGGRIGRALAT